MFADIERLADWSEDPRAVENRVALSGIVVKIPGQLDCFGATLHELAPDRQAAAPRADDENAARCTQRPGVSPCVAATPWTTHLPAAHRPDRERIE